MDEQFPKIVARLMISANNESQNRCGRYPCIVPVTFQLDFNLSCSIAAQETVLTCGTRQVACISAGQPCM